MESQKKAQGFEPLGLDGLKEAQKMRAWNNWLHCTITTYGTWLRGDPRGWRSRHHREHVEGDYKNPPPPGTYEREHRLSKSLMKRAPVKLNLSQRTVVCKELANSLLYQGVELVDLCVDVTHTHILARFVPLEDPGVQTPGLVLPGDIESLSDFQWNDQLKRVARQKIGLAKSRSARALSADGFLPPGRLWGIRGLVKPVRNRKHQLQIVRYIRNHAKNNAVIWSTLKKNLDV